MQLQRHSVPKEKSLHSMVRKLYTLAFRMNHATWPASLPASKILHNHKIVVVLMQEKNPPDVCTSEQWRLKLVWNYQWRPSQTDQRKTVWGRINKQHSRGGGGGVSLQQRLGTLSGQEPRVHLTLSSTEVRKQLCKIFILMKALQGPGNIDNLWTDLIFTF